MGLQVSEERRPEALEGCLGLWMSLRAQEGNLSFARKRRSPPSRTPKDDCGSIRIPDFDEVSHHIQQLSDWDDNTILQVKNILHGIDWVYFDSVKTITHLRSFLSLLGIAIIFLGLNSCSLVFPVLAPFSDLPAPTGPYSVGTRVTTWADSSREDTFTDKPDARRIVVQVWYPTQEKPSTQPRLYIDDPELRLPAISKQLRLPVSLIKHFDEVKTNSGISQNPEFGGTTFPVLLFSHGLSGMRFQNTALMEELASHGYVVFAADHSYEANITIFDNGETAEYRAGKRRALNDDFINTIDLSQLGIIVDDLKFILDQLSKNYSDSFTRNLSFDLGRVGVIGHSLGGAAIINAMATDDRIKAAMVLDGWYTPVPDSVVVQGLTKPIFHLGQKEWSTPENYDRMDSLFANSTGPVYKLLIPHAMHTDFTDMPLFTPFSRLIGYTAATDPLWMNTTIRKNTSTFFDVYLKGHEPAELTAYITSISDVSSYIFIPIFP